MTNKVLKTALATMLLLLLVFITLTKVIFFDYEKPIGYERINQISFNNFRGLEFFQKSLYSNKSFAYVKTSIDYEFKEDSIKVESYIHPSNSYVYSQKAYNKDLLTHEIYHLK